MFSLIRLTRPCMSSWPLRQASAHFQTPFLWSTTARTFGTDDRNPLKGRAEKLSLAGKPAVMVPLGSQKVFIPSEKQAAIWKQKAILVEEYVNLDPQEKKIVLMDLSIKRFICSRGNPPLRGEIKSDVDQVRLWINSEADKSGVVPVTHYLPNKNVDITSSIIATVNKCLAREEFQSQVRVQSVSEYFWEIRQRSEYIYPFTSDSDELHTMVDMGLPFLSPSTLYHEVGIGSGEGIIEVIRRGAKEGRVPGCVVGTDINMYSLESLRILIEEGFGGLENVFLRRANAADPLDTGELGFNPNVFVVAANRFFSVLDPKVFGSVVRGFSEQIQGEGYLVTGINTTSPENVEMLKMYEDNPDYQIEETELGKVLYEKNPFDEQMKKLGMGTQDLVKMIHEETGLPEKEVDISKIVLQVFYDPDRFIENVEREHFAVLDRRVVKENLSRLGILFKKKGS